MSGSSSIPKDVPIYLQFLDIDFDNGRLEEPEAYFPRYKWYVIEEDQDQTTDRVRHLPLPKLDFNVVDSTVVLLASDSRIFLVGGQTGWEPNGILSIDSSGGNNNDLSWKRCDEWARELSCPLGASVFRDENNGIDCIYVVILREKKNEVLCYLEESGGTMTCLGSSFGGTKLISSILPLVPEHSNSTSNCKVVVGEVLICFLPWSPLDKYKTCPALYVYNIGKKEWLSEPLQGLPNDGVVLPLLLDDYKYEPTMENPSLFQVRTGARKLALVWSIRSKYANIGTQVHWTKFTLNQKKLRAEDLSSGTFDAGNAQVIKSATG